MVLSGQFHSPAVLHQVKSPDTHWTGGSVGPRAGLEAEAKRKNLHFPCRELNPSRPDGGLVTVLKIRHMFP
jgi:hypothetical protein